jgi:hypothetical protein
MTRASRGGSGNIANRYISTSSLNQKPLYRVMSEVEVNAVRETGLLRGGRSGRTYFTDAYFRSSSNAQNRLSLEVAPTHIMQFEIMNNPNITGGNRVQPLNGGIGGSREYYSLDTIMVNIVNIQPMR